MNLVKPLIVIHFIIESRFPKIQYSYDILIPNQDCFIIFFSVLCLQILRPPAKISHHYLKIYYDYFIESCFGCFLESINSVFGLYLRIDHSNSSMKLSFPLFRSIISKFSLDPY